MTSRQVRVAVVGHVDHGKSTLIGRLIHETGLMPAGRLEQLADAARRRGAAFEWANLMDGLQAERDQNVTIDTAHIWLRLPRRDYVLIDAPGHKQFLRNMVTGAALADAALIVLDAAQGVCEQSRRHGVLLKLLGVRQVVVVINKLDLVQYGEATFERVRGEFCAFLEELAIAPTAVVPVSARDGANLVRRDDRMPWFTGDTMIDALDRLAPRPSAADLPFRLPVQDVYRLDHGRVIVGRVEAGTIRRGDPVTVVPGGHQTRVAGIERWGSHDVEAAAAGDSIGLTLADPLYVVRGGVVAAARAAPTETTSFSARIFWLGSSPLALGRDYRLKLATQDAVCTVQAIDRVVDGASLEARPGHPAGIESDEIGEVRLETRTPVVLDPHTSVPALGRFVLLDGPDIRGGGVVLDAVPVGVSSGPARTVGVVTRAERERRQRHRGAVVWLTGYSGAGKSTLADAVERALFDRGVNVFVLDGDDVRQGLNAGLGFSPEDRAENIRRAAEVAKLFAEAGAVVITAFISPYASDRLRARAIVQGGAAAVPFLEVHVDAPLEECERRDPKGLYAKARSGRIIEFTGVSAPYEPPEAPDLRLPTAEQPPEACVASLVDALLPVITLDSPDEPIV
jgi:bifunctional enzyme CysN/CysC